ncbi:hypothetical protein CEXT_807871 [Caerostris extrusa]|uniref:Uncharacterized protein n=1 Tax=Caerostris extrusa TaxID=172846 RepID=A0AAV4Y4W3_CAEEX|nr:hypothetical protein CEXT_807871 [Caerostris extrusa]
MFLTNCVFANYINFQGSDHNQNHPFAMNKCWQGIVSSAVKKKKVELDFYKILTCVLTFCGENALNTEEHEVTIFMLSIEFYCTK